jgi:hypothetical protein
MSNKRSISDGVEKHMTFLVIDNTDKKLLIRLLRSEIRRLKDAVRVSPGSRMSVSMCTLVSLYTNILTRLGGRKKIKSR